MSKPWFRQLKDDEWIDDIRIRVVPRLKESELSGDEWRVSAAVDFSRKGRVVKTENYHDIRTALAFLSKYSATNMYPGSLGIMGEITTELVENYCMQPGCSEPWTVEYNISHEGCGQCGTVKEVQYTEHHRRFCETHSYRGDSDLDDMDAHYVKVEATADGESGV